MAGRDGFDDLLQGLLKRVDKRGPRAGVSVSFRARGVVIRAVAPVVCERCGAENSFAPLEGRSPGIYPAPPRGTVGLMCDRCAHVEYVRKPPRFPRVMKALGFRL